jgi:hypothetical protein
VYDFYPLIHQPKADPPKIHRVAVPPCIHVGEEMLVAEPTAASASAHASDVVPGVDEATERRAHTDPLATLSGLAARTATIDSAIADAVVMMSGVGINSIVAVALTPDCV